MKENKIDDDKLQDAECWNCHSKNGKLREYNSYGVSLDGAKTLPETLEYPLDEDEENAVYCDDCVDKEYKKWWDIEKNAYIYDNCGNHPDDPEFSED